MEPTKADNWIGEEHLLNFIVNSLNAELTIDLGGDVEVSTQELYEVLAGASASGTVVNHTAKRPRTLHTPIPSVDTLPISSTSIPSNRLGHAAPTGYR